MDTDEIMSARDLALLFAGGREAEKLAEAMTAWKIVHLRAERAACALVAKKEGYPEWDEDIPQRHRAGRFGQLYAAVDAAEGPDDPGADQLLHDLRHVGRREALPPGDLRGPAPRMLQEIEHDSNSIVRVT